MVSLGPMSSCVIWLGTPELVLKSGVRSRGFEDLVDTRYVTGYTQKVIVSFKHRGLRRFFEAGDTRGLNPDHVKKIRRILARLNVASEVRDLDAPGLRLHQLKGRRKGQWAVDVDRNWRITFVFDGRNCAEVNYEDYH